MMSLGRTLLRYLFRAGIGHQVTYTVVEGGIFEPTRRRLSTTHPRVDEFVHCHLCVGTWIGIVLAVIYRPQLLGSVDARPPTTESNVAYVASEVDLIALGNMQWHDATG